MLFSGFSLWLQEWVEKTLNKVRGFSHFYWKFLSLGGGTVRPIYLGIWFEFCGQDPCLAPPAGLEDWEVYYTLDLGLKPGVHSLGVVSG